MTFNIWTFLFEVLNFVVLAFVLQRLLYRPLRAAIDKRKAENDKARTDAEAAHKDAETARAELATKLAEADKERQELLRKAAEQGEVERAKRLAEADAAAKVVREQAHKEADQLRSDTIAALEGEIRELAIGLAERILTQSCTVSLNGQLAHRLIETIRAVTGDEREGVRRDTGTGAAVVESVAALDDAIRTDLTAAIHELLGHPCQVTFELNPSLIGGARVRAGGHVWDATIAAQLDAARATTAGGA